MCLLVCDDFHISCRERERERERGKEREREREITPDTRVKIGDHPLTRRRGRAGVRERHNTIKNSSHEGRTKQIKNEANQKRNER